MYCLCGLDFQIHYDVDEPFTDLAVACKTVLDPMVMLMQSVLKQDNTKDKRVREAAGQRRKGQTAKKVRVWKKRKPSSRGDRTRRE